MILLRIVHGVRGHFSVRASEWLMIWPTALSGVILLGSPTLFDGVPGYAALASWAEEETWGTLALWATAFRLAALVVNGTFAGFRLAPHARVAASGFGAFLWGQFCLGSLLSPGATWLAPVLWSTFVLVELLNWHRAWGDIGAGLRRHPPR